MTLNIYSSIKGSISNRVDKTRLIELKQLMFLFLLSHDILDKGASWGEGGGGRTFANECDPRSCLVANTINNSTCIYFSCVNAKSVDKYFL